MCFLRFAPLVETLPASGGCLSFDLHLRHGGGNFIAAMENALGLGAVAEDGGGKGCGKDNDTGFHNNLRG